MNKINILIVDDEVNITKTIAATFAGENYRSEACFNGDDAWDKISNNSWDVVFLDLRLPGMSGMDVLKKIYDNGIKTDIVITTAHGTVENAVQAMKYGAVDFISKPLDPEGLRTVVANIMKRRNLIETKDMEFDELLELAKLQIKERNFPQARIIIRNAITLKPESAIAYNMLGAVYEVMEDKNSAVQAYQMAIQFEPSFQAAKENLYRLTSMEANTIGILDLLAGKTRDDK